MNRCACWQCRRGRGLAAIAPTLALAWRQEQALRPMRREQRARILHLKRLVAHRELQAARAGGTRNPRYIAERGRKLQLARNWLSGAERRLGEMA